jgi:hypothetical protein
MSAIQISSPILKGFIHSDVTLSTTSAVILDANATSSKRIIVLIQNKSATAVIQVRFAETGTVGIIVPPLSNISIDNYNGHVRAFTDTDGSIAHVAYSAI